MEFILVSGIGVSQHVENTVQGQENVVIPENPHWVLKFVLDSEDSEDIIRNFCAVLNKSWKFVFPNEHGPRNPWHYGAEYRNALSHNRIRIPPPEDKSVEVILRNEGLPNSISETQLRSIIWRLANAFEWCTLPNRKRLSGHSSFTRDTWNAISVYRSANILAKTTSSDSPAQDPEPAVSDHQVQTDAAE
jgi:hypothetical protein